MPTNSSSILELYRAGHRQCDIVRLLNVPKQNVSMAIIRFKELGHDGSRPKSGRSCTVNTPANRQIVRNQVKRNSNVSMRKISRETGISHSSVKRIFKQMEKEKDKIIALYDLGKNNTEIVETLKVDHEFVASVIENYKKIGETNDRPNKYQKSTTESGSS